MNKTRQALETVNFRLYFKVIIRQNKTQYFTYSIYTEQESENTASPEREAFQDFITFLTCLHEIICEFILNFIYTRLHLGILFTSIHFAFGE